MMTAGLNGAANEVRFLTGRGKDGLSAAGAQRGHEAVM